VQSEADPHSLFALLLASLVGFFLLEKAAILRHNHHFEGDPHDHEHGHDARQAGRGGLTILIGDGIHKFADGMVIAAAFVADTHLGVIAALSIVAHEIPQEIGDFMVLLNAGISRKRALFYNMMCGASGMAGGVVGYLVLDKIHNLVPYALIVASASFIYIALSDLVPQLQRDGRRNESFWQVALMGVGIAMIYALFMALEGYAH
jgi:zinc and cadmium transporter